MEQTRYLMWSRSGRPPPPPPPLFGSLISMVVGDGSSNHYETSWEEQAAFAEEEDSLGLSGVWPPRSYSCSFCGREFRSAQALGGHMNVHRRDRARARLKQLSSSRSEHNPAEAEQYYPGRGELGAQIIISTPDQYCDSNINHNPNSDTVNQYMTTLLIPPLTLTLQQQQQIDSSNYFPAIPPLIPARRRLLSRIPDLKLDIDNYWKLKDQNMGLDRKRDLQVLDDHENMAIGKKLRRRFNPVVFPTMIFKPTDHEAVLKQQLGSSRRPVEELDLELRLGDHISTKDIK